MPFGYSPNLNPIERLWKVMNEQVRNNVVFESAKAFREQLALFFSVTIPKIKRSLGTRHMIIFKPSTRCLQVDWVYLVDKGYIQKLFTYFLIARRYLIFSKIRRYECFSLC